MEHCSTTVDRINYLAQERSRLYLEAGRRSLEDHELQRLADLDRQLAELWQIRRRELVGRRDYLIALVEAAYQRPQF